MAALAAPVTLLDCPLPAINNIDVPTDTNSAQKEAIFKEVKASLRFALLRSSASATGGVKLYMVVPTPCRVDQVCVAELTAPRLQIINKSIKSLGNNLDLVVRGTEELNVLSGNAPGFGLAVAPPKFFVTSLASEVTIRSLGYSGEDRGSMQINLTKLSDNSACSMDFQSFLTNIDAAKTESQGLAKQFSFNTRPAVTTPPGRSWATRQDDGRAPRRPSPPPLHNSRGRSNLTPTGAPRGASPRGGGDGDARRVAQRCEVHALRSGALALDLAGADCRTLREVLLDPTVIGVDLSDFSNNVTYQTVDLHAAPGTERTTDWSTINPAHLWAVMRKYFPVKFDAPPDVKSRVNLLGFAAEGRCLNLVGELGDCN